VEVARGGSPEADPSLRWLLEDFSNTSARRIAAHHRRKPLAKFCPLSAPAPNPFMHWPSATPHGQPDTRSRSHGAAVNCGTSWHRVPISLPLFNLALLSRCQLASQAAWALSAPSAGGGIAAQARQACASRRQRILTGDEEGGPPHLQKTSKKPHGRCGARLLSPEWSLLHRPSSAQDAGQYAFKAELNCRLVSLILVDGTSLV